MASKEKHTVILIPGLGDDRLISKKILTSATNYWSASGLEVLFHPVLWRNGESFHPKLLKLVKLIDELSSPAKKVSLVGTSAGASLAFTAFYERSEKLHKAVNVCGRLRTGNHAVRSLSNMAKTSPAFYESVQTFEKHESQLTSVQRQRLMTIRPFFGDELVPRDTAYLDGAHNQWIYTPTHMLSIYLSLRFPKLIIPFLMSN